MLYCQFFYCGFFGSGFGVGVAVQTGDNVSPMLYAGAAMTAAAVLALIQRKRRKG